MDRNLIIFPTNGKNIQEVDSGITKVYLVVLGDGLTGESLYLDGHFSGDDITYRPEDLPVLDLLAAQDNYDRAYFPNIGQGDHHLSIPFQSINYLGQHPTTLEYLDSIYLWTAKYENLTPLGQDLYQSLQQTGPVRIITISNI